MTQCCTHQTSLSISFSALLLFCSCAIVGCRLGCFRSAVTRLHTCTHYSTPTFKHRFTCFGIIHMIYTFRGEFQQLPLSNTTTSSIILSPRTHPTPFTKKCVVVYIIESHQTNGPVQPYLLIKEDALFHDTFLNNRNPLECSLPMYTQPSLIHMIYVSHLRSQELLISKSTIDILCFLTINREIQGASVTPTL